MVSADSTFTSIKKPESIFRILVLLSFILLPFMSLDSGISGDEPVHNEHAGLVLKYFESHGKDTSALYTPETHLKYYGQAVDNFSLRINRMLHTASPWTVRHLISALFGAATIWFCGLLAWELAGAKAAVLAIILLFFTPRFLGHSLNNLKDVPFAFAYLFTLFSLIRFIKPLPRIRWMPVLGMMAGTGLAIAVRAGGIILIPILVFFIALQVWMTTLRSEWKSTKNLFYYIKVVFILLFVITGAWLLGIIDWPWARQAPWSRPIEALNAMTRYQVSIRQLFEGKLIWSENLPWYYPLKFFAISTPLFILIGLFAAPVLPWKKETLKLSALYFASVFPLLWVIIQDSNLYGGFRHLLFIIPVMAALAAASWIHLMKVTGKLVIKRIITGILMLLLLQPAIHIVRNHPLEYIYFNSLTNGIKGAWAKYETDYYYASLLPALKWLDNQLSENPKQQSIIVASNFPLDPYLKRFTSITKVVYTPWHARSKIDWDYGLFVKTGIVPSQFKNDQWPPDDEIHRVTVSGYPVCTVLARPNKSDLQCRQLYLSGYWQSADSCFTQILNHDPGHEMARLYQGYSLLAQDMNAEATDVADQLLTLYPDWEPALVLKIKCLMAGRKFSLAFELVHDLRKLNPKFAPLTSIESSAIDSLKASSDY